VSMLLIWDVNLTSYNNFLRAQMKSNGQ